MIAAPGLDAPIELRLRLADLYAAYDDALDEQEWERWPEFFTENAVYKVLPRENFDQDLPAAMVYCESRAMLADRVVALREALVFAPRLIRRVTGTPCLRAGRARRDAAGLQLCAVRDDAERALDGVSVRPHLRPRRR